MFLIKISPNRSKEKFRVYIFLSLLPGYNEPNPVRSLLYFLIRSTMKDDQSLFKRLGAAGEIQAEHQLLIESLLVFL